MPSPLQNRERRLETLKRFVMNKKETHINEIYSMGLSTWGITRKKIEEYVDDLVYMGFAKRNNDHVIYTEKERKI